MSERPTGLTRDAGWQIGVSRTLPVDVADAWRFVVSTAGLRVWLGDDVNTPLAKGQQFTTADGTVCEIRSLHDEDRIRLTWQPPGRPRPATVQLALTPAKSGTTFRFHTERLVDADEREHMRAHWKGVLDAIQGSLTSG